MENSSAFSIKTICGWWQVYPKSIYSTGSYHDKTYSGNGSRVPIHVELRVIHSEMIKIMHTFQDKNVHSRTFFSLKMSVLNLERTTTPLTPLKGALAILQGSKLGNKTVFVFCFLSWWKPEVYKFYGLLAYWSCILWCKSCQCIIWAPTISISAVVCLFMGLNWDEKLKR